MIFQNTEIVDGEMAPDESETKIYRGRVEKSV